MSELSERLRESGLIEDRTLIDNLCAEAADELDLLQLRLDFLLGFLSCEDVGDQDLVVGVVVNAERLEESLVITKDCGLSGCLMDGWTCDWVKVIDRAIEKTRAT